MAAATDFGAILLLNYPAVVEGGPFHICPGHSSHVSNVKWMIPCRDLSKADPDPNLNPNPNPNPDPKDNPSPKPNLSEADPNPNPNPNPNLTQADPDPAKNQGEPPEQELLISAGGADRSIFQWRLVPKPGHAVPPAL